MIVLIFFFYLFYYFIITLLLLLGNASYAAGDLDGTLRFCRWQRSRALSRSCHRYLATSSRLPSNAEWRSEGKALSREGEMAVPPRVLRLVRFDPEALIPRIGYFLSAFVRLLRISPKEVSRSTATKFRTPIVDFLCVKVLWWVEKDRTLAKKFQIEFVSKGSWTPDRVGDGPKKRALEPASFQE